MLWHHKAAMTFQHPEVQRAYEQGMGCKILTRGFSYEERQVFALMDIYFWFQTTEGRQAAKAQEIVSYLLSPELRPAVRSFYQEHAQRNPQPHTSPFTEFRDYLGELAGERFA